MVVLVTTRKQNDIPRAFGREYDPVKTLILDFLLAEL
jgi:hypothetical protein